MLLGVLALIWLAVLTPPLLRARAAHRAQPGFSDFYASLSSIGGHGGAARVRRPSAAARRRTAERRRRVFTTLGTTTAVCFVGAAFSGSGTMWLLFTLALVALGAYVGMLVAIARSAVRPTTIGTVHYLPSRVTPVVGDFQLRHSAGR